ncbi:MAG: hypothetical protein Q9160_003024 [Pyrenula sp. 1 TL-2023]
MSVSAEVEKPREPSLATTNASNLHPRVQNASNEDLEVLSEPASRQISRQQSATQNPSFSIIHEISFVAIICSAQILTQASFSQTLAATQFINDSFNISNPGLTSWNTAAYSLTVGTFILISGRFGDLYGHKKLFIIGWCWFALWSLLAGFSVYVNQTLFACCRAFQGLGPSVILPNGVAILGRTYPPGPRKNLAMSLFAAAAPNGSVIGAVFTSILCQFAWWPWCFWVLAIGCLFCGLTSIFVIPPMPRAGPADVSLKELDPLGAITGVGGLVLIDFAWNQGPTAGWQVPYVYILLIVGFVLVAAFFWIETRVSKYPLIPMKYLPPLSAFVFGCIAAGWSSFGIWIYYLWQLFIGLRGQTPLLSAAQCVPAGISGGIAAVATGFMLSKGVRPGVVMLLSLIFFTIGNIVLATVQVHQTYWANAFVSIILAPWGMDLSFPAGIIILSDTLPREHQGVAASLVNTIVNYSISIGLGFAGTIEVQINDGGRDVLKGYRGAWYMGIGLSGMGIIISLMMIWSLQRKEKSRDMPKDEGQGSEEKIE